jgi:conjugal transfer pilus assembly protein TraL
LLIKIEQRLQDPKRLLILPFDEAMAFLIPFIVGVVGREIIIGTILGVIIWIVWGKIKGERGLDSFIAASYWYIPTYLRAFDAFPNSTETKWEG